MTTDTPGALYDGKAYSLLCDHLLAGMHARVAAEVDPAARCIDMCCGTGGLSFQLAARCVEVRGVDHSARMIARAEVLRQAREIRNVDFEVGNAADLASIDDGAYDVATVAMALHEMPHDVRVRVLPELLRVAAEVVIVDFAVPMPLNTAGLRNRFIEFAAGPRHFRGFLDYTRRGGLQPLIEATGALVERARTLDRGTLRLVVIRG